MKFILGKKIEMTQIWQNGKAVAVTKIQAGPCLVTQIKNIEKDGYDAVQIGFGQKKEKNIKKPQQGHLKKLNKHNLNLNTNVAFLREFRMENGEKLDSNLESGDIINAATFEAGDIVKASGVTKGRGFQGVVKRHKFSGGPKTHGDKDQLRMPGSIGSTGPKHVFKGVRMAGRMGNDNVTISNLEVIQIDPQNNFIYIKGAVPGARNGLILIKGAGELKPVKSADLSNIIKVEDGPKAEEKEAPAENKDDSSKIETEENIEKVVVEANKKVNH